MSGTTLGSLGTVRVAHRLALGLECFDAASGLPIRDSVTAAYRPLRVHPGAAPPAWRDLMRSGPGRPVLLHGRLPGDLLLRLDDPTRRYLPRRFSVHPWALTEASEPAPYVPVVSRLLRVWLHPASAYSFPRTATVLRGRVARHGEAERRARVVATRSDGETAGLGWTDDRGEFVLPIIDTGQNPVRSTVVVTLVVHAPREPVAHDEKDPGSDLAVEDIPRSSSPPTAAELDNDVLRGTAVPAGYVGNAVPARAETVPVGAEHVLIGDIEFTPEP